MADPRWKQKLRKASFRGVPFYVESHSLSGGRRGVQHEYAQRDTPFTEDTGRKGRKFSIEAYVLGDDYMSTRDALIKACEEFGPGELIHPYLGRQIVNCFDFSVKETTSDGGMAVFTMNMVESGQELFPDTAGDGITATKSAAEILKRSKLEDFLAVFDVSKQPQYVLDSAADKVRSISDYLLNAKNNSSSSILGSAARAAAEISLLRSNVSSLIQNPRDLYTSITRSFNLLFDSITDKRAGFQAASSLTSFGRNDPPIKGDTVTREVERRNREALNSSVRIVAIADASIEAVQMPFESVQEAEQVRGVLLSAIDQESMSDGTTDDVYSALSDLRVEVVKNIPASTENLAVVSTFTPKDTVPSLVAAYDVYGSVSREQDIVNRNKIQHPGFILGGSPIEVLLNNDR